MAGRGQGKPTLGYPSRTQAIIALKREGLDNAAIAERLGLTRSAVSSMVWKWDNVRSNRPVKIPAALLSDLAREADRRGVSIDNLVGAVLRAMVRDKLFGAILDD